MFAANKNLPRLPEEQWVQARLDAPPRNAEVTQTPCSAEGSDIPVSVLEQSWGSKATMKTAAFL